MIPDETPIPLSTINNFTYCARRFYLANVEGAFVDNVYTLRGDAVHEGIDDARRCHHNRSKLWLR